MDCEGSNAKISEKNPWGVVEEGKSPPDNGNKRNPGNEFGAKPHNQRDLDGIWVRAKIY